MSTELVFRAAEKSDIPLICETRKIQLVHEGIEPNQDIDKELLDFFSELFDGDRIYQVLVYDRDKFVGTGAAIFYDYPPSYTNKSGKLSYITNMFTLPEYRGRGIATKILSLLEEETKRRGIITMRLGASKLGRPVYEKFGFEQEDEWLVKRV